MKANERATARRKLDNKLIPLQKNDAMARPARGWIKAIREALGMTTRQYAKRIGLSQSRAVEIEKAEMSGAITLDSLRRAAEGLECRLIYALVPTTPLERIVEKRATTKALQHIEKTRHTMALEDQSVDAVDEEEQIRQLALRLLARSGSGLWDDD